MKSKVFILSLSLVIVLCSSFSVFGASTVVNFSMTEPSTSDTQGYAVFHTSDGSNAIFIWNISPKAADSSLETGCTPSMNLVVNSNSVTFTGQTYGGVSATYCLLRVTGSGSLSVRASGNMDSTFSNTWSPSNTIEEWCAYGNVGIVDNNISGSSGWLRVNWGNDADMSDSFDEVINELVSIDTHLLNISSSVDGLESKLDTVNTNLTRIRDYIDTLESTLNDISGDVETVKNTLNTVNERLGTALTRLNTIISNQEIMIDNQEIMINELQLIREALNYSLEDVQNAPYVDNRPFYEFDSAEDSVLEDNTSAVADLKLEFGNAFDVVWDLISQAWQINSKVFTVVIMCLTIGVIKLVFNR